MVMIKDFPKDQTSQVKGTFVLKQVITVRANKMQRTDAVLQDISGKILCIGWDSQYASSSFYGRQFECLLRVTLFPYGKTEVMRLYARPVASKPLAPVTIARRHLSSAIPETVKLVHELIEQCKVPLLQQFIRTTLNTPQIAQAFFNLPASREYHHDYPGGLAKHSIEAVRYALPAYPLNDEDGKALIITATLFHDIGKVKTMRSDGSKTTEGRVNRHEYLNLEVLAEPLKVLEQAWPDGATALRYLLTLSISDPQRPLLLHAMAVKLGDRTSTYLASRAKCQARSRAGENFFYTDAKGPKSRFWLLDQQKAP